MPEPEPNAAYTTPPPAEMVQTWRAVFARQRAFAEHAFDQLDDAGFFWTPAPGLNSVAIIARHLAGNMASRWGAFPAMLTGQADGESPTRDRDAELAPLDPAPADQPAVRAQIVRSWEAGWAALDSALAPLTPTDLGRLVPIRGVPHPVHAAVARQLDHYAFHVGQINVIARLRVGTDKWRWFTLAPGGTAAFNAKLMGTKA